MRENEYQAHVIRELKARFTGCIVLKNDSSYQQGIPDLIVLYKNKWACLEVKPSYLARLQPNQQYWVDLLDSMSMAAIIFPENESELFDELAKLFRTRRALSRVNH